MRESEFFNDGPSFLREWIPEFVHWMKAPSRSREITEVLSDSPRETFLNSLVALHMRRFGMDLSRLFFARCEWGHCDIFFGKATQAFNSTKWNEEWKQHHVVGLGVVEAKLIYESVEAIAKVKWLAEQLRSREDETGEIGEKVAMIWRVRWSDENGVREWLERIAQEAGLETIPDCDSVFADLCVEDLTRIWPVSDAGTLHLDLGIFRLRSKSHP